MAVTKRRSARLGTRGAPAVAALALLVVGLTACSSSGSSSGRAGTGSSGGAGASSSSGAGGSSASGGDSAAVQGLLDRVFGSGAEKLGDLDPIVQETFKHAAIQLTSAQLATAVKCWKGTSCDLGSGGKVTLGIAESNDVNLWRKTAKMEIILQALTYPQIGKIIYTDAQGDLSKYQANVRSLVAQGAKVIVGYDDFGSAALPAYQQAQARGVYVSTYVGGVPNAKSNQMLNQVHADICAIGKQMADVAKNDLKLTGPVAILNGTPGNPQGQTWNKCFQDALSGSSITVGTKQDTNWSLQGAFKAGSALVSSGKKYSGIFYDYADPVPQIVQAYTQAGAKVPPIVTWTSNNGAAKVWEKAQGTANAWDFYYTNALTWEGRVSLTALMEKLAGKDVEENTIVPQPFLKATKGLYQSNRPDDYPGPSALIPDDVMSQMLSAS
jgi:ABC-type sugar transport system substrate-binding protein